MSTTSSEYNPPSGSNNTADIEIEKSALISATVDVGQNVNVGGGLDITTVRVDPGWSELAGGLVFTGSPDRVEISAIVLQGTVGQVTTRTSPGLKLVRRYSVSANWASLSPYSATGYIRGTQLHTESSNTITFIDENPGTNPHYRFNTRQETSSSGSVPVIEGRISALAVTIETVTVLVP